MIGSRAREPINNDVELEGENNALALFSFGSI